MKKNILLVFLAASLVSMPACVKVKMIPKLEKPPEISIVPRPQSVERLPGVFTLSTEIRVIVPTGKPEIRSVADYFISQIAEGTAVGMSVVEIDPALKADLQSKTITFNISEDPGVGTEGYTLLSGPDAIRVEAAGPRGFFNAVQTIFELHPPEFYSGKANAALPWTIPAAKINDAPRYAWRGMLLDVSRHFFPKEFIKKFIGYLAMHKMNTFHWHLTDDQGWRVEIKKYPRLTEVGAWRVDREDKHWNAREPQKEGETATYGGFYTQDEIREVVAYAKSLQVTIVPEIELPGHCLAALASYPEYSCSGGPFTVPPGGVWPITNVYCPGKEKTFAFLEDVLAEVLALFPGEVIHIGGDEVDKANWKKCPDCQARIKAEGLKNEDELQSYFVKRIEKFLNAKGRKLVGWDEILEGGLAPNAAVMSWRGTEGGIAAAKEGHNVVMTPTSHCYFDYYQGQPAYEPPAIGGFLQLSKVYEFEPTPAALSPDEAKHILGVQANLWTEYVPNSSHAEYMTFPRIAAIAEVGWSPKELRDWDDFGARMNVQFERYRMAGINYAKSSFNVRMSPELDRQTRTVKVKLETEMKTPEIRYSFDGVEPGPMSMLYAQPIFLKKTSTVKAGAFFEGELAGRITETRFVAHKALGKAPRLTYPFSNRYKGGGDIGLVNGLRGSKSHTDGLWQGFEKDDLLAEIDLGKTTKLKEITAGFLHNIDSWIFFPTTVEFAVSGDGHDFRSISTVKSDVSPKFADVAVKDFSVKVSGKKARFVRIHAKNIGLCPDWHSSAGGKAWLFADEIIIE